MRSQNGTVVIGVEAGDALSLSREGRAQTTSSRYWIALSVEIAACVELARMIPV
jgi:tRNA threonylcarbamoyladenosine modification (KEOPS) complex  Pcc1 subunit